MARECPWCESSRRATCLDGAASATDRSDPDPSPKCAHDHPAYRSVTLDTTLDTVRLRLVPYAPVHLLTLIEAPERFEEQFGYPPAEGLHDFFVSDDVSPTWLALLQSAAASGSGVDLWVYGFAMVHRESRQVIGSASFKGPPDEAGVVEIAYGVVPHFEGQGLTTEAVRALLDFAFGEPRVRIVRAHTAPRPGASPGILRKCGFTHLGAIDDPEDGLVWRWERRAQPV